MMDPHETIISRPAPRAADPADRERVLVDTFAERYLLIVILVPMGLLFTLIGLVPLATCLFRSP